MNILMGSLYGTWTATTVTCFLTSLGSLGAYEMGRICGPLVEYYLPKPVALTRKALTSPLPPSTQPPSISSHLLLARFLPILPYSVTNVVSGVLSSQVPRWTFCWTLIIGSFPYNFVTTEIGELMAEVGEGEGGVSEKIWSGRVMIKLLAVTVVSVVPMLFKDRLQRLLSGSEYSFNSHFGGLRMSFRLPMLGKEEILERARKFLPSSLLPSLPGTPPPPQPHQHHRRKSSRRISSQLRQHRINKSFSVSPDVYGDHQRSQSQNGWKWAGSLGAWGGKSDRPEMIIPGGRRSAKVVLVTGEGEEMRSIIGQGN